MRRKISLSSTKSSNYVYSNFKKQFSKALEYNKIGEVLTQKQVLQVLKSMGFINDDPSDEQIELTKTLSFMLSVKKKPYPNQATRSNLFTFLMALCDISYIESEQNSIMNNDEALGLASDDFSLGNPLVVIEIGRFDYNGRWSCSSYEVLDIQKIFSSMKLNRMSKIEIQSRTKQGKHNFFQQQTFQPKICPKSSQIIDQKKRKLILINRQKDKNPMLKIPVQNRLSQCKRSINKRTQQQLNRNIQKQLEQCTFMPVINHPKPKRNQSKQNISIRSNSQQPHFEQLLQKGNKYRQRKQKLHQLKIQLNQSIQSADCTFKPHTTKSSQSSKWFYVRNRDKEIQRLRQGRKQRDFVNQIKQRGYPCNINWSQFITRKALDDKSQFIKAPVLCIDLKIMNQKFNIDVYEGENISKIAQRIGKEHKVPEKMWWKVEELIKNAISQCQDVRIEGNQIYSEA